MTRRDQISMKRPAARGRGGGRGGGRGRGRKSEPEQVAKEDDEEVWGPSGHDEVPKKPKRSRAKGEEGVKRVKSDKMKRLEKFAKKDPQVSQEVPKKKKAKAPKSITGSKRKTEATPDVDAVAKPNGDAEIKKNKRPKRSTTAPAHPGNAEVSSTSGITLDVEETVQHIMDYLGKIDLQLTGEHLKASLKEQVPFLDARMSLNIYWTTSRCGLKVCGEDGATRDSSFSFNGCYGKPNLKLAVAIASCLELVTWLTFKIIIA